MGTENAMLAATLAEGHTVIRPAAQEPEVDDLIAFLQKMGAEVERTYPDTIEVGGKRRLRGAEHHVIPDRIEAGTFVVAGAVTGGEVSLDGAPCDHMTAFLDVLGRAGVGVTCEARHGSRSTGAASPTARFRAATSRPRHTRASPTDIQSPTCVLLTQATGVSHVHEAIFEDRLEWLSELNRMGPKIDITTPTTPRSAARRRLHGAEVEIGDLRAGASLILAALAADGRPRSTVRTTSSGGMRTSSASSCDLGARIERLAEGTVSTTS